MGLTLAERRAVTETTAVRYILAGKRDKSWYPVPPSNWPLTSDQ